MLNNKLIVVIRLFILFFFCSTPNLTHFFFLTSLLDFTLWICHHIHIKRPPQHDALLLLERKKERSKIWIIFLNFSTTLPELKNSNCHITFNRAGREFVYHFTIVSNPAISFNTFFFLLLLFFLNDSFSFYSSTTLLYFMQIFFSLSAPQLFLFFFFTLLQQAIINFIFFTPFNFLISLYFFSLSLPPSLSLLHDIAVYMAKFSTSTHYLHNIVQIVVIPSPHTIMQVPSSSDSSEHTMREE